MMVASAMFHSTGWQLMSRDDACPDGSRERRPSPDWNRNRMSLPSFFFQRPGFPFLASHLRPGQGHSSCPLPRQNPSKKWRIQRLRPGRFSLIFSGGYFRDKMDTSSFKNASKSFVVRWLYKRILNCWSCETTSGLFFPVTAPNWFWGPVLLMLMTIFDAYIDLWGICRCFMAQFLIVKGFEDFRADL